MTEDYIKRNIVFKVRFHHKVFGFYSIVENTSDFYSGEILVQKGFWLEHIFIFPEYHNLGIGRILIDHAKETSKIAGINKLFIFADPFAKGFYDKIGASYLYDSKSSMPNRMIPVYELIV